MVSREAGAIVEHPQHECLYDSLIKIDGILGRVSLS
jgi:hypothetical protein